ncbi:MAG: tyrosinase family protein [Cocleimonas sp.]|nr:tyrosinase family protein [Cocleimonas sp.]
MAIRKDANTLSAAERTELVNAILALKENGLYDQFVLRHANASMGSIHSCPAFLPWHRRYLWDFEKALQDVSGNPNLGVPYWNWSSGGENASMWADDFLGGDGDANGVVTTGPFRSGRWRVVNASGNDAGPLLRTFGRNTGVTLPTEFDIQQLLQTTPYDVSPWNRNSAPSFRNQLEGWQGTAGPAFHNLGHVWIGGSMLPMTSPNDPVFFIHHCMVDKLWHEWQLRFPAQSYLPVTGGAFGQNLNDVMDSTPSSSLVGRRPVDVLDSSALGILYDSSDVGEAPAITDLTPNATETPATIDTVGEVHQYQFTTTHFDEHTIETTGSSDTFMTLYGPNDATNLVTQNDDGGDNLNAKITANLSVGEYRVSIRLYSPTQVGEYAIKVSSLGHLALPELVVNGVETSATISASNESDLYRFSVMSRGQYIIETTGSMDTFLTLLGPNDQGQLIEENDDGGVSVNSRIRITLNAGEYYAKVRHFSADGMGAYAIRVRQG